MPSGVDNAAICNRLKEMLRDTVYKHIVNASDSRVGMLLSGGLDSSILAALASSSMSDAIFALCIGHGDAQDTKYARIVADRFRMRLLIKYISIDEMLNAAREIVRIMRSFDPMEVRNSIVLYLAMKELKEYGLRHVITGDGCDEIFAGYSYLLRMSNEQLEHELTRLERIMHFSSIAIADALGMSVSLPYLDVLDYAKSIPLELKVNEYEGKRYGKFVLRSCFEHLIGKDIAWRVKMPMEQGANTSILSNYLASLVGDEYLARRSKECLDKERVRIRSKEHLYYYEIYRSMFGAPYLMDSSDSSNGIGKARCSECNAYVSVDTRFCRICGAFPITPIPA
ncbi:MAG: asparagine synthase-related protein [Candidatus Nitrosocaldus sp.]